MVRELRLRRSAISRLVSPAVTNFRTSSLHQTQGSSPFPASSESRYPGDRKRSKLRARDSSRASQITNDSRY